MIATIEVARASRIAIISVTAGLSAMLLPPAPVARPTSQEVAPTMIAATSFVGRPSLVPTSVVAPAMIASTADVRSPAVTAGASAVTPVVIAGRSAVAAPTVTLAPPEIVATPLIPSGSAVPSPTVTMDGATSIGVSLLGSTSSVRAPSVQTGTVEIAPTFIASTSTVRAPAVAAGAVTVAPAAIPSQAVIPAPVITVAAGGGYDADAQAYFTAMSVQPTAARKALINDLIVGLKADNLWAKLDWLVLLASQTQQQALLNARSPAKSLSAVNSPGFTTDRGVTGDATMAHLSFGEAFNAAGNVYALNSSHIGVWCNLQGPKQGTHPLIGSSQSTRSFIIPNSTGVGNARINDTTSLSLGTAETMLGGRLFTRTASNARAYFRDGALSQSDTTVSAAIATGPAYVLRNGVDYADDRLSAVTTGAGLTTADVQALHSRLSTFLTIIGAN